MTTLPATAMRPVDAIVYDIEIAKCIPDRGVARDPGLEYCAGWDDHPNMGIAVLCAFDTRARTPRVFLADNLDDFARLIEGRVVAGFNNHGFDDKLLAANGITVGASYDLCAELRAAVGEPRAYTRGVTKPGRTLDALCQVNLGTQKPMTGALAPKQWQRGQRGAVIDYCLYDVMSTARLIQRRAVIDPVTMASLELAALPAAEPTTAVA